MNDSKIDAGIPVLTEIIQEPTQQPALHRAPKTHPSPDHAPDHPLMSTEELHRLEQEIRTRVLQQVLGRIDFVLEQRIKDNLTDVVETAVAGLTEEIRHGLRQTLADVIARAVTQEIAHLQSAK